MTEIREMIQEDIPRLAELERLCFSDPWSENAFSYELKNPLSRWLVAVRDGQVVGYIGSQTVLDASDMMNVAVDPQYRRQGIGEILVHALVEALDGCGAKSLSLEVRVSNTPAITLYKKLGFAQVGIRKGYYRNPREDAYILRKEWV